MPTIRDILFEHRSIVGSCWLWTGSTTSGGYGQLKSRQHGLRDKQVHRVSFELFVRPLNANELVCHSCDNRICFNPAHLFVSNHAGNTADMHRKGRSGRPGLKLTDEEIHAIIVDTRAQRLIAIDYSISQQHVSKIKRGTRRH